MRPVMLSGDSRATAQRTDAAATQEPIPRRRAPAPRQRRSRAEHAGDASQIAAFVEKAKRAGLGTPPSSAATPDRNGCSKTHVFVLDLVGMR